MTALYLTAAWLGSACFYLAAGHQTLLQVRREYRAVLRFCAWICCAATVLAGSRAYGWWPGVFASLAALMLGCVALPYLDAWRRAVRGARDVE
jgi:hypothetical protein